MTVHNGFYLCWLGGFCRTRIFPLRRLASASSMHQIVVADHKGVELNFLVVAFEFWYHVALSLSGSHFFPHLLFAYHPVLTGSLYMEAFWIASMSSVNRGWGPLAEPTYAAWRI